MNTQMKFSKRLANLASLRATNSERVYLSNRQSMTVRVFLHVLNKRAETPALLDSGATENFIHHQYAAQLKLPTKRLPNPRKIYNVDGTTNKKGNILFYTDLEVRTGEKRTNMRFFLTDLGPQKMILGYPWFAAVQPKIDWARGWIDYTQLPVVIKTPDAVAHLRRLAGTVRRPRRPIRPQRTACPHPSPQPPKPKTGEKQVVKIPDRYKEHAQVFDEQRAQRFPTPKKWDHAIDLKPNAPSTLPGKVYSLTQPEQQAL